MNSKTSEIFEFNKMLFIYFCGVLVLGTWLISRVQLKRPIFKPAILILMMAFVVSQMLSTLVSIDPHTSFYGYYGRFNGGLLSIITYVVLFFVFLQSFDQKSLIKLLKISLISSTIVILWGLTGKVGADLSCLVFTGALTNECWTAQFQPAVRMFSTIGQPNWLGAYLAIHFFVGLFFFLNSLREKRPYWIYAVYLIGDFAALIFTRSRSSLLALFIGVVVWAVLTILTENKQNLKILLRKSLPVAIGVLLIIFIFKTGIPLFDNFISFGKGTTTIAPQAVEMEVPQPAPISGINVTESFDIRKIVWRGAIDLGLRYPLLGTGVETFAYAYYFTRPVEHNYTSEWDFIYNKAHNEYLNYFATTGFIGTLSYVILICGTLWLALKKIRSEKNSSNVLSTVLSAYITILVTNFFGFSTTTINLFFYLIPGFFLVWNIESHEYVKRKLSLWQKGVVALIGVGMLVLTGRVLNYFRADVLYARSTTQSNNNLYQEALSSLDDALKLKYEHVYEDKLSLALANLSYLASQQEEEKLSSTLLSLARGYNAKALKAAPKNVIYWRTGAKNEYLFFQVTQNTENLTKAVEYLKVAMEMAPTDPKLPYSQALFYSTFAQHDEKNKKAYQKNALDEINRSIKLKPNYRDAYLLKGQILKQFGRTSEAKQTFQFLLKNFDPQDVEVLEELKGL